MNPSLCQTCLKQGKQDCALPHHLEYRCETDELIRCAAKVPGWPSYVCLLLALLGGGFATLDGPGLVVWAVVELLLLGVAVGWKVFGVRVWEYIKKTRIGRH